MTKADKLWVKNNPEKVKKSSRDWKIRNPWVQSYHNAKSRCTPGGKYYNRGIKFLMSMEDFKYLWIRDSAIFMNRPSIDRIKTDGDYILSNCKFIEFHENMNKPKWNGWNKLGSCLQCDTIDYPHYVHGLCKRCYRIEFNIQRRKK